MESVLQSSAPQPEVTLPQGTFGTSRKRFLIGTTGEVLLAFRDAPKHPTMHSITPTTQSSPAHGAGSASVETPVKD